MLFGALGPLQKLGFACGNAHRTSTSLPTRRSVTPPRLPALRIFAHSCSSYGEVSDVRCRIFTRSVIVPLIGAIAVPGRAALPLRASFATSEIFPSEMLASLTLAVDVWKVNVAFAFAPTTL